MTFIITERAQQEIDAAIDYYLENAGIEVARGFLVELNRLWDLIIQYPKIGTPTAEQRRIIRLNVYPYSVVYRVRENDLVILIVAHQRRNPSCWQSRQ